MKRYANNSLLLIPDTHFPYHHKDTFTFLREVRDTYRPDRVIHMGDITDSYCFSRYPKDIEMKDSYTGEYRKVRKCTEELLKLFPSGILLESNHDARLWERAKMAGIPKGLLIPYMDVIGLTDTGWTMKRDFTLTVDASRDQWYLAHTRTSNPTKTCGMLGMSVAFGHTHTKFMIETIQTPLKRLYGVTTGCLLGGNKYAFSYNRQAMVRPSLGCVVVLNGVPKLIPLDTNKKGRWDGKVA